MASDSGCGIRRCLRWCCTGSSCPRRPDPRAPRDEKPARGSPAPASCRGNKKLEVSAVASREDAEEGLDVGVGAHIAVVVEVGGAGARWGGAVAGQAREEGLDVRVGADVPVAVEVGGAADREQRNDPGLDVEASVREALAGDEVAIGGDVHGELELPGVEVDVVQEQ